MNSLASFGRPAHPAEVLATADHGILTVEQKQGPHHTKSGVHVPAQPTNMQEHEGDAWVLQGEPHHHQHAQAEHAPTVIPTPKATASEYAPPSMILDVAASTSLTEAQTDPSMQVKPAGSGAPAGACDSRHPTHFLFVEPCNPTLVSISIACNPILTNIIHVSDSIIGTADETGPAVNNILATPNPDTSSMLPHSTEGTSQPAAQAEKPFKRSTHLFDDQTTRVTDWEESNGAGIPFVERSESHKPQSASPPHVKHIASLEESLAQQIKRTPAISHHLGPNPAQQRLVSSSRNSNPTEQDMSLVKTPYMWLFCSF